MKFLKICVLSSVMFLSAMSASLAANYFVCHNHYCDRGVGYVDPRDALYHAEYHHKQWINVYVPQYGSYVRIRRSQLRNEIVRAERRNRARAHRYSQRDKYKRRDPAREQLRDSLLRLFDKAIDRALK